MHAGVFLDIAVLRTEWLEITPSRKMMMSSLSPHMAALLEEYQSRSDKSMTENGMFAETVPLRFRSSSNS